MSALFAADRPALPRPITSRLTRFRIGDGIKGFRAIELIIPGAIFGVVLHLPGFPPHVPGRVDVFPDIGVYNGTRFDRAVVYLHQVHQS
jgi:hypothetical protein